VSKLPARVDGLRSGRTCTSMGRGLDIGKPDTEREIEVLPVEEPLPAPAPAPVEEPAEQPIPA